MRDAACDTGVIIADAAAPGSRHVDDVFGEQTARGVTRRDGWLCGPGTGDNAIAVATAVAVIERALAGPGEKPLAVALGCCVGEDLHAPTERIRADSIAGGAGQLQALLAEILD